MEQEAILQGGADHVQNYGCVELFSGGGGLAYGIERAGFRHVLLVEHDANARATIELNNRSHVYGHPWALHEEPDARKVDFTPYLGKAQLVAGGPPCQPFSIGGAHRGHLDQRDLFPTAIRAVREIEPAAFIFENVRGLLRPAFSGYVEYIRLHLAYPHITARKNEEWTEHKQRLAGISARRGGRDRSRYQVTFNPVVCADYGAPQVRFRVFFIGIRADISDGWKFPLRTHSEDALLRDQFVTGNYWRRHGLPARLSTPEAKAMAARLVSADRGADESPWQTVRDTISRLPKPAKVQDRVSQSRNQHVLIPGARAYAGHTGSRLDWPAKALKAGVHGIPGGENMLAYDNGKVRYFTVREAASLQGFPQNYLFDGSWVEVMRQIGNAVPVMVAETVARSVREHLVNKRVAGL